MRGELIPSKWLVPVNTTVERPRPHRRRPAAGWPAFGRRRLRRQSQPDLLATQRGTAGA